MPRYGKNLETLFERQKNQFSLASILDVALAVLNMLEKVHAAGFVYNDLKLDNILLGYKDKVNLHGENIFSHSKFHLVDFGFCTRYNEKKSGEHLK